MSVGTIERERTYTVRTQANLFTPQTAGQIVIRNDLNARGQLVPVLLSDIAEIKLVSKKRTSFRRLNGKDAVILNALRERDSNVVETMENLRLVIDEMNEDVLKSRGLNLRVVYDETDYIASAIDLVKQNIWVGGCSLQFWCCFTCLCPNLNYFHGDPDLSYRNFCGDGGSGYVD